MPGQASEARTDDAGASTGQAADRERLALSAGLTNETTRIRLAGVLLAALVASVAACGVAWQRGEPRTSALGLRADARDEARSAVLRDVETLMTADYRNAEGTFESWAEITTGRLHAQIADQQEVIVRRLEKAKEVTTVRTLEAALSSWDEAAGTARLLAVLELRTSSKSKPSVRTVRYLAMTQRVDGEWMLSAVQQLGAVS